MWFLMVDDDVNEDDDDDVKPNLVHFFRNLYVSGFLPTLTKDSIIFTKLP